MLGLRGWKDGVALCRPGEGRREADLGGGLGGGADQEVCFERVLSEMPCQHPVEIWLYDSGILVQAGVVSMLMSFEAIGLDEITREWDMEENRALRTEPRGTPEERGDMKVF